MIIYKITNTINSKIYIGQTKRTIEQRMANHRSKVNAGSNTKLHNAMRKYGIDNFIVEVIDSATNKDELDAKEIHYIAQFNSVNAGYNMAFGGGVNPMDSEIVKTKHKESMQSEETRHKISESMKEVRKGGFSEETLRRIAESRRKFFASGKKPNRSKPQTLSYEHKRKLIAALKKPVCCSIGGAIHEFDSVYGGAHWWKANGYDISLKSLCAKIKKSIDNKIEINGVIWYRCE